MGLWVQRSQSLLTGECGTEAWALGSAWETAQDLEVKKGGECSPAGDGQQRAEVENGEERPKDS